MNELVRKIYLLFSDLLRKCLIAKIINRLMNIPAMNEQILTIVVMIGDVVLVILNEMVSNELLVVKIVFIIDDVVLVLLEDT